MRLGCGLAGSAALMLLGLAVAVFFGLIGRSYGAPCTTDPCTNPGADMFLYGGAVLVADNRRPEPSAPGSGRALSFGPLGGGRESG